MRNSTSKSRPWLRAVLLAALLGSVATAQAQGPGWTANSVITKLVVTADGSVNIRLSPELSGCVSASGYGPSFASIYPVHPGINRMKAMLLTAYTTGATVALYLSDSNCTVIEILLGGY